VANPYDTPTRKRRKPHMVPSGGRLATPVSSYWDPTLIYQAGDACSYCGLTFRATGPSQGLPPVAGWRYPPGGGAGAVNYLQYDTPSVWALGADLDLRVRFQGWPTDVGRTLIGLREAGFPTVDSIVFRSAGNPAGAQATVWVNSTAGPLVHNLVDSNLFDSLTQPIWLRAHLIWAPGTCDFYQSLDGQTWNHLFQSTGAIISGLRPTDAVRVGSSFSAGARDWAGDIYEAEVRSSGQIVSLRQNPFQRNGNPTPIAVAPGWQQL
jgi:hypothetical protein